MHYAYTMPYGRQHAFNIVVTILKADLCSKIRVVTMAHISVLQAALIDKIELPKYP